MTGFWLKRRLLRTGVWLLVALLTAGLAFSMGILRRAHEEQQQKLRELEKSFPIWLQVSNPQGTQVDDLEIETLRSTDAGVAFYVKTNGASFYHAGDLNNWKWDGAGELVNGIMDVNYKNQIKKLAKKDINLAFVPFDPKLGMYQSLGMEYFLENTNAEYVFPMHMWQDYSGIQPFIKRLSNQAMADRIVPIVHENQVFEIREE